MKVKCKICAAAWLQSRVYVSSGATTAMGWEPFYDERGVYHSHDPNAHTTVYRCSVGHEWYESKVYPCPAGDYA